MKWTPKIYKLNYNWQPWFAWHPVRLPTGEKIWLERVLRRVNYCPYKIEGWFGFVFSKISFAIDYEYRESVFDIIRESGFNEEPK